MFLILLVPCWTLTEQLFVVSYPKTLRVPSSVFKSPAKTEAQLDVALVFLRPLVNDGLLMNVETNEQKLLAAKNSCFFLWQAQPQSAKSNSLHSSESKQCSYLKWLYSLSANASSRKVMYRPWKCKENLDFSHLAAAAATVAIRTELCSIVAPWELHWDQPSQEGGADEDPQSVKTPQTQNGAF